MGIFKGNSTCPLSRDEADLLLSSEPITGSFTFQDIVSIVAGSFAAVTLLLALWLVLKHLHRYTVPSQQRQIIRIIFTPIVYSILSVLSILFYDAAKYIIPLRNLYECFALASLFLLFLDYAGHPPHTSSTTDPRSHIIIFGYVSVIIIMTIVALASQATGTFCATSMRPRFAHVWVTVLTNAAVVFAVMTILKLYSRLRHQPESARHKPLLKLLSFKLIVFLNFVQNIVFSVLVGQNVLHGTRKVTGKDLTIGIPSLIVTVEQLGFAIFFHYAFRTHEYKASSQVGGAGQKMGMLRAAVDAINPWELIAGIGEMVKLLMSGGLQSQADVNNGKN